VYSVQEDPVCVSVAYPFTSCKPVQEDPIRVSIAYSVQDDPHSRIPLWKTQVAYPFNPRNPFTKTHFVYQFNPRIHKSA